MIPEEEMILEEKLNAVRNYFKAEFPNYTVLDKYEFDYVSQTFCLMGKNKKFTIPIGFLKGKTPPEIVAFLKINDIGHQLMQEGVTWVIVENDGSLTFKKQPDPPHIIRLKKNPGSQ